MDHIECIFFFSKKRFLTNLITYTLSITIHPTNGGVAPLYNPRIPSFFNVFARQSIGPLNFPSADVCIRTLMVSKGWPTVSLVIPENTPATKPAYLGGCFVEVSEHFGFSVVSKDFMSVFVDELIMKNRNENGNKNSN